MASGLDRALAATPADAQVIAQVQVVGRFAERRRRRPTGRCAARQLPIQSSCVVLVVLRSPGSPENATLARLRRQGARVLVDGDGVEAVRWHPPAGQRHLRVAP